MADLNRRTFGQAGVQSQADIDEGLRAYMLKVYNYMAVGLALTGVAALVLANLAVTNDASAAAAQLPNGKMLTELGVMLFTSPLRWVLLLAPVGLVFFLIAKVPTMSVSAAQTTFWVYAALVGTSLSSIFIIYTPESITQVFFVTSASFLGLSLYGYTTKRDVSAWGGFLIMGLIGIVIASIVNLFIGSSALQFAVSVIGVLVFAGLTVYDTQQIKNMYDVNDDGTASGRKAIMGALKLYLDFINLFIMLLHLFGNRN